MLSLRSGAGLDGLQDVCDTVVFGELDWSPGVHKQFVGRVHRPGQQNPITAYFCVTDFGADPHMLDVLNLKAMEADLLVNPQEDATQEPVEQDHSSRLEQMARDLLTPSGRG